MGRPLDPDIVKELLRPIVDGLDADGYVLSASVDGGRLVVRIEARPGVCGDCLVPKHTMSGLLSATLEAGDIETGSLVIEITYPTE